MDTKTRRDLIIKDLTDASKALSATTLAKKYNVSRQVIVGDIALLRALKHPILATARGYIYEKTSHLTYVITSTHNSENTKDELETIIDLGADVIDVFIEHPIYGELRGNLNICSRHDINEFITLCENMKAKNLSVLSEGIHFHTIHVPNEKIYLKIVEALKVKGYIKE